MSANNEYCGLLLIDKPAELTSHDVVARARRILRQKSIGHTGTLDPMATGLMILVLGGATKLSDYILTADKAYQLSVRFGITTDTLDRAGTVLSETPCDLDPELVREAAIAQQGEFEWAVPIFSAAKVDGKKLYEYARSGEAIATPIKKMNFWGVDILEVSSVGLKAALNCSKGGFIRTWAAKLGETLGVGAVLDDLRRVRVGAWSVTEALTLEALEACEGQLGSAFIPLSDALPSWKPIVASEKDARLMRNGQIPREIASRLVFEQKQSFATGEVVFIKVVDEAGELLAILASEQGQGLKIRRVFRAKP